MPDKNELPDAGYFDVGTTVARTGFTYKVIGPPRDDGKYPVEKIIDGRMSGDIQHFSGKDLVRVD